MVGKYALSLLELSRVIRTWEECEYAEGSAASAQSGDPAEISNLTILDSGDARKKCSFRCKDQIHFIFILDAADIFQGLT
jgi:hypothetical protein